MADIQRVTIPLATFTVIPANSAFIDDAFALAMCIEMQTENHS